jgi:hypothetical protein
VIKGELAERGEWIVANANKQSIVDPDKPDDLRRLRSEAPLVRALALKVIEEELGVETRNTVYRKHLHELAGFKEILGTEAVELLVKNEQATVERSIDRHSRDQLRAVRQAALRAIDGAGAARNET